MWDRKTNLRLLSTAIVLPTPKIWQSLVDSEIIGLTAIVKKINKQKQNAEPIGLLTTARRVKQ